MELPKVRYYLDGRIYSDWVEVEYGEAMITARLQLLSDGTIGWADQSGLELIYLPKPSGKETDQSREENRQGDERVQGGDAPKRQARSRKRSKSQES